MISGTQEYDEAADWLAVVGVGGGVGVLPELPQGRPNGNWEMGVGSRKLTAGCLELGVGSVELGVRS